LKHQKVQLSDITTGQNVIVDDGFTCMKPGIKTVKTSVYGDLYVDCCKGRHLLDGRVDADGFLIGIFREKK